MTQIICELLECTIAEYSKCAHSWLHWSMTIALYECSRIAKLQKNGAANARACIYESLPGPLDGLYKSLTGGTYQRAQY